MFNFSYITLIAMFAGLLLQAPVLMGAEDFGRFFTTPKQREALDQVRSKKPEEETIVVVDDDIEKKTDRVKPESAGSIRLKGLVYRGNKKSTAWINDGNTYEGNLESQYFEITEGDISEEQVRMGISGDESGVKLRVGQTYDPDTGSISDVTAGAGIGKSPPAAD